jgi:hypothetical protein
MVVAAPYSAAEAAILVGRLQHLGVPAVTQSDSPLLTLGITGFGGVKVLVPEKFYDLALAALHPDADLPLLEDGDEDGEDDETEPPDADDVDDIDWDEPRR